MTKELIDTAEIARILGVSRALHHCAPGGCRLSSMSRI